jgi:[protein-PII] uridylyltransferase
MTIDRICELRQATDAADQRFSQVLADVEDQAVLIFALLFHQMGAGPDAAALARQAATRIQLPAADQELLSFLIESQTWLLDLLGGRDLDDSETIRRIAGRIGTIERLRPLALLTYADLAATYSEPVVLWRLDQLWRAYKATERELTRELESDRIQELPDSPFGNSEFITGFPTRYLRARSSEEIRGHIRLYERSRSTGVAVELEPILGAYRLTVVADDRPALFASFAGAISSFGLDIVKAEAYGNSRGIILDTFVVADPRRTLSLNPSEAERLQDLIARIALGKTDARRLLRNREGSRAETTVEPVVQFSAEASETATLVEIIAQDRPGLLYSLASVFATNGCNIDTVLIDTKGNRAMDVFYVAREGQKIPPEMQALLERQLLAACLGAHAAA